MQRVLKGINANYFNSLDYELYIEYKTRVIDYEINDIKTNLVSILFTPIFLLVKIAFLTKDIFRMFGAILLSIPYFLKDLFYVIFQISILTLQFYYEKIVNLYNIIITITCMIYAYDNVFVLTIFSFTLGIYLSLLIRFQKHLVKSYFNTNQINERYNLNNLKYIKLLQLGLYITSYFITDNISNPNYKILILTGFISDIVYNSFFSIYIYKYSKNILLLDRYGLSNKIIEIINSNVSNIVDTKLDYLTFTHTCDTDDNGNCSKCPCGICFENLTEATKLKCGHIYDKKCIRTWALYEYSKNARVLCPSCRIELI